MEISINEESQRRIRQKVESGLYSSADDVLLNALDLLDVYDVEIAYQQALIRESKRVMAENVKAGISVPEREVFDEVRRRLSGAMRGASKSQDGAAVSEAGISI